MDEIFEKLKKYNFWGNEELFFGYKRDGYLKKIHEVTGNKLVKVLMGQRRSGKSYILRQVIGELINQGIQRSNIFYLNKELIEFEDIKNFKDLQKLVELYRKAMKIKGKVYYFFDEIQEIEQWEKVVNSLSQNYKEKNEVFISGSNSKMLSSELATYLSGRYVAFEIYPFSFKEYLGILKLKRNRDNFIAYLKSGGLPEIFNLQSFESKLHYISSLKDTIILKDIIQRNNIKDSVLLERLFRFLTDNIGNIFSIKAIVDYLESAKIKASHETISNYLNYLLEAYVFYGVDRYDLKGKAILAGGKKYYLNDLAFKNYLSSGFDQGLGKNLENVVYLYYRSLGYMISVGVMAGNEVDFVLEKGKERKYVQVTHSLSDEKVVEREFGNLEKIRDSFEKTVISLDDSFGENRNGIKHVLAWDLG